MENRKKKILMVNEASWLHTGYSNCGRELLERLYKTDKYELAELACYGSNSDPRINKVPWKVYGNLPDPNNPAEVEYFNSNTLHQFGSWKFEEICVRFKPDIVFAIRDWVMDEFLERSPFRAYYHLALMPTVDSIPQHPQWLSTYMNTDSILTYSNWGAGVLKRCNDLINVIGVAPAGVDFEVFKPTGNKVQHKITWGLPPDSLVIGTTMRNQTRKLFPDLLKSFRLLLDQSPPSISSRLYLYMHTSYPDWWDFPTLLTDNEVSQRCLFSYKCQACNHVFAAHFRDARSVCPNCQRPDAFIPNTHIGFTRKQLADVYNLMDVYVQYANSGGQEIPPVEAAACNVHSMVVDYSAMEDYKTTLKSTPIKPLHMLREGDNGTDKAIPDNQDLVDKLIKFFELPESWRAKKGFDANRGAKLHYDWDKTAKVWEDHFDTIDIKNDSEGWNSPLKQHTVVRDVPINLPPEEFVEWGLINIAGRPDLCNHYMALKLLRDIQWGSSTDKTSHISFNDMSAMGSKPKRKDFNREAMIMELKGFADYMNYWELRRAESNKKDNVL